MVSTLLVEANRLLREALGAQLESRLGLDPVHQAATPDEAIRLFRVNLPKLVLMDIQISENGSFEAVRQMRKLHQDCQVVFLTGYDYDAYIERALQLKADGYVLKGCGFPVLEEAIVRVTAGERYFCPEIRERLEVQNGDFRLARPRNAALATLTSRERELLKYLGRGASLKEAAAVMSISYKTADNQKASLMRKLGIHDRVELARFAIREGIVTVE